MAGLEHGISILEAGEVLKAGAERLVRPLFLSAVRQQAVPANQVHDFHPPISASGLYWVVAVPERGLSISADGNMDLIATPARMSFKMIWKLIRGDG